MTQTNPSNLCFLLPNIITSTCSQWSLSTNRITTSEMEGVEPSVYSPQGPREIRIITHLPGSDSKTIICTLKHVCLDDNPKYEALSYAWGMDEFYKSILIDGKSLGVRRTLWFALFHLRQKITPWVIRKEPLLAIQSVDSVEQPVTLGEPKTTLSIWIEALCIDQNTDTERSSQVEMMGSIYETCKNLRIWLGEQTP